MSNDTERCCETCETETMPLMGPCLECGEQTLKDGSFPNWIEKGSVDYDQQ